MKLEKSSLTGKNYRKKGMIDIAKKNTEFRIQKTKTQKWMGYVTYHMFEVGKNKEGT